MKSNPPEIEIDEHARDRRSVSGHPEETFSKVFAASPNPICNVSIEGETFIDVNESYTRFTGYSRIETIGRTSTELNLWVNKNDLNTMRSILMHKGRLYNYQLASRMKSGEIRTGLFSAELANIAGRRCMVLVVTDITEQKWAADALKESEEFTSSLLNNTPNPIFVTYPDTAIKYVNPAFEKLTGFGLTEIIGMKAPYPWWPDETKQEIAASLIKTQFGSGVKMEMAYQKRNGKRFWVEVSATLINKNSERKYILVNWVDITDRKQLEDALRFSDAAFKSIHESIIAVDNTNIITYWNNSSEQLFGIKASEAIDKIFTSVIRPVEPYPGYNQELYQKLVAQGYNREELLYQTPHGDIWVDMTIQTINKDGRKSGYVIMATDITERKQAEKSLQESEEKFSKSFSSASDAMAIFASKGGKFVEVNDSYINMSGYSRDELIGHNADELCMWGNPADRERILQLTQAKGRLVHEEFSFRTKSGEMRTCLFSAESISIGDEKRMIVVLQDITEREKAEEKHRTILKTALDGFWIIDLKGRMLEVNESYCNMMGYTREELLGMTIKDVEALENSEETLRRIKKIVEQGSDRFETRHKRKDGQIIDVEISTNYFDIEQGQLFVFCRDITERKKAEEALRDSEEKFSKAFLASPGAIAISTVKEGRFIDVNDSFYQVMGYTRDEAIGRTSKELNIWVENESRKQLIEELEKEGHPHNKMIKFRKKSGEIGIGMFSAEKIVINDEPCIISVNMEVTQQIRAEESLRLLGSVTQQVTDSIVVTDPEFKITYMNKAAQALFGYSIDEALGRDIGLLDTAPLPGETRGNMLDTLARGKTWAAVLSKRRKDGSTFPCDCRRSPLFDEGGRLASYIIVHRDITEQKETEAKLKAHKQMNESILASMPEGVLVTDSSDRIMLANESFRRIFHTGRKVIDNRLLNEVLHVGQLLDLYISIKMGNNESHSLEFRYKVKDMDKVIDCAIIKMDSERMLLIFSDVSREREEEDKLYLMDRLASLGEMAAGLAHELNNPLTGILTLSQLLVNSDLPDEHKEDLQCVYSEAKRAANIVKNVLLFTRNNSYENGRSSVNEVVKEVLRLREHEEKVRNINVVTKFQDNLPEIQLDKYQLQQVFLNIILNAEAAIAEAKRPGTLTVTTEQVNNHVNIMFTDNGCGIKKQILPRIFDPFFTTKEIGKGTGLGLSICYGIIVKHNGKISVQTRVGKGTTFTIRMPIADL